MVRSSRAGSFSRLQQWLRPRGGRSRRGGVLLRSGIALVAGALIGLAAYQAGGGLVRVGWARLHQVAWPPAVEVRVLDVGEGSAALVRTPQGHAVLVDAGPPGAGLARQLRGLGVASLDLVVVSHPHADHFGGLAEIAGRIPVGLLVDQVIVEGGRAPPPTSEAGAYAAVRHRVLAAGARPVTARSGLHLRLDGVDLEVFAPEYPLHMTDDGFARRSGDAPFDADELNAASLVVAIRAEGVAILLPGDAEAAALERYRLPPVDALVVPHHGSRGAVTARLLRQLAGPRLACVSAGVGNSFGHPAPETLGLLERAGVSTVRTDRAGWIGLLITARGLRLETERLSRGVAASGR